MTQQEFYQFALPFIQRGDSRRSLQMELIAKILDDNKIISPSGEMIGYHDPELAGDRDVASDMSRELLSKYAVSKRMLQAATIPPDLDEDLSPNEIAAFIEQSGATMSPDDLAFWQKEGDLTDEQVEDALLASRMAQVERDAGPVPEFSPMLGDQRKGDLFPSEPEEIELENRLEKERYEREVQSRQAGIAEEKGRLAGETLERRQAREFEQAPKAMRRRELMRLVKEGGEGFRSDDPLVNQMAAQYGQLRRDERRAAIFGSLRNVAAAAGEQLTGRAIKRGPLTPQMDPSDTTAADRAAAQKLLVSAERGIPKLFAVDAANIKEARSFMIDLIDQVRQRGDAREKNSLDASVAKLSGIVDLKSEHMHVGFKLVEGLAGDFSDVRTDAVMGNEFAKAVQGAGVDLLGKPIPVTMNQVFRKVANNQEEVDNMLRGAVGVLETAGNEHLKVLVMDKDESVGEWKARMKREAEIVRKDFEPSHTYSGMTPEQLTREIQRRSESNIARAAAQDLIDDPNKITAVSDLLSMEGFADYFNNTLDEHISAGFAEQALGPLAKEYATMLGYADPKSMMAAVMGRATSTETREDAIKAQTARAGRMEERAFQKPNPFRTRQFKAQLLLPENRSRLQALDTFAKGLNLNRDDALKALAIQWHRDQKKSRETTPNVLAQIAKGQTAAEIKAQRSLKTVGEPGVKRDVDVISKPTPAPPSADEDVEEKGQDGTPAL